MAKKEKFNFVQPFKDIPKLLKGFPKNVKHILKDEVTNMEEAAARKKEVWPLLYLCAIPALILAILGGLIVDIQQIALGIAIIPLIGVVLCANLLRMIKKLEKKFADLECTNCKARIAYGPDVQYKVTKVNYAITKSKESNSKAGVDVTVKGKETTAVEITCKCQECGTVKTFTETFRTAECSKRENVAMINADIILASFEKDIRAEQKAGFDGSTGANIKYKYDLDKLVKGYFGNEVQM